MLGMPVWAIQTYALYLLWNGVMSLLLLVIYNMIIMNIECSKLVIVNLNTNSNMHRSVNSTQLLSKTYSRVKLAESALHRQSPHARPFSSRSKKTGDIILHEALITKNKKLSMMIRTVHGYMTNIEQLDWIMNETQKIIKNYIKITVDKYGYAHKMQIQNIYNQITKLITRFAAIDKKVVFDMTVPLKQNRKLINSQNINLMNLKKTQTIDSFKCHDTQNQQDGFHTDFSKIRLPAVIKENQIQQNIRSSRFEHQTKIKQYQATIQILREQIQAEKQQKQHQRKQYQSKIAGLNKKIQTCHTEWEAYKIFATSCIRKCKLHLNDLSNNYPQSQKVESILDQLFAWDSKLDRKIVEGDVDVLQVHRQKKIVQIMNIQSQLKQKKDELDRIQTQRIKLTTANTNTNTNKISQKNQSQLVKMLFLQATTIQHLI